MTRNWRGQLLAKTILAGLATFATPAIIATTVAISISEASAQDYSSANLTGTVVDKAGAPVPGASVKILSQNQGFERNTTTNDNGEFRVPLIPQGAYTVTVTKAGLQTTSAKDLRVQVGSDNSYRLVLEPVSTSEVVVVTGVRPQEQFSQTTTGVSIDVEDFNKRLPIARNITALTLLAPGAVPADPGFSVPASSQSLAPASVGGASGAENAFFVNGLNITNFVNGIGGASVPFYFYQSVDVKTGGYQAEFGRATGGVINAVTKSGSNAFTFGAHVDYEPNGLREDRPNTILNHYSLYDRSNQALTLEAGGPIIPDHLFFYALGQWQKTKFSTAAVGGDYIATKTGDPFYGFKLDGYITDTQHLEFTYFDTSQTLKRHNFAYDETTDEIFQPSTLATNIKQGGESYVGRYTGTFFDNLVVSAAYGRSEVDQATAFNSLQTLSLVQDVRGANNCTAAAPCQLGAQSAAARTFPFLAEREFYRGDIDYFINFFGDHHFRAGYDQENTTLSENSIRNGDANYVVRQAGAAGNAGLGLAAGQQYIERRVFISGGGFDGTNKAYYLQDSWDVTNRLNVSLGWRKDQFQISDPNGQPFLSFQDEQALRFGASYDIFGDKSTKVYGYYGRFYLPAASNTSFRAAAPAIDVSEYFRPAGGSLTFGTFNSTTGLPTAGLGPQITGTTSLRACPTGVGTVAPGGSTSCLIRNTGASPNPDDIVARDVKSTYEDQYILGLDTHINDNWSLGIEGTYSNLGRVSEDILIEQGVLNYCARNNITGCDAAYAGSGSHYRITNPGEGSLVALTGAAGTGETLPGFTGTGPQVIYLTAQDLGFPKARREYLGVTFKFDRAFDGVWGVGGSYTLSRSEGNFEGALKSDVLQTDAGITEDFDFLSFIPGQYGLLPNHRAHQVKLYGSYSPIENLMIGSNFSVFSPRKYGCFGGAPNGYADGQLANDAYGVPANARFCNGIVVDRGSAFSADWIYNLDLSVRYTLPEKLLPIGRITLRADVFNVLNTQNEITANENGETGSIGNPDPTYRQGIDIQQPRYFRFGIDYEF